MENRLFVAAKNCIMISKTPKPPYYAVIFTSTRTYGDNDYSQMADKMIRLAKKQEGFLGIESAREGLGITVSYWADLDSIKLWRENMEHKVARKKGRETWYEAFTVRIAKVEKEYSFDKTQDNGKS